MWNPNTYLSYVLGNVKATHLLLDGDGWYCTNWRCDATCQAMRGLVWRRDIPDAQYLCNIMVARGSRLYSSAILLYNPLAPSNMVKIVSYHRGIYDEVITRPKFWFDNCKNRNGLNYSLRKFRYDDGDRQ